MARAVPLRRYAGLAVVMVVVLTAGVGTASGTVSVADGSRSHKLAKALRDLVQMPGGPPGAVAVVRHGGERHVYTAGVANVVTEREIRVTDHMRVASVAKAFSGAAALSLVHRGRLSLTDTIGERLPDLPQAWHAVTLGQLLQHTSGLPDFTKSKKFIARATAKPLVPLPPGRLLEFVAHKPLGFPPGSRYEYSNSDNVAVGLIVKRVTGTGYAVALRRLVSSPLGLSDTRLPRGARMPRPFMHGYDVTSTPPEDVSQALAAGLTFASGGVVSTPADLSRFIRGYAGAQLFGRRVQERQLRLVDGSSDPPGPGDNKAGLGIFRYETRCGTVFGHTGNFPGYTQFIGATLSGKRSATVSVTRQLRPDIDATVFDALRRADRLAVCAALDGG